MVESSSAALLISVSEAARLLGISRNLTYDLVREGRLPHIKLGRRVLVPRHGLENWIAEEAAIASPPAQVVELSQPNPRPSQEQP